MATRDPGDVEAGPIHPARSNRVAPHDPLVLALALAMLAYLTMVWLTTVMPP